MNIRKIVFNSASIVAMTLAASGCVSLGIGTQASNEQAYVAAASVTLAGMDTGEISPSASVKVCAADTATYGILTSTRTATDGTNYTAADTAHATLQAKCAALSKA